MSEFFKSEMVRGELQEMMDLQQQCFRYAMSFPVLEKERRMEYLEILMSLLEKQEVMYARMSLSDDEEAQTVVENMRNAVVMLGGDPDLTVNDMFMDLRNKVDAMMGKLRGEEA
tara:strand:- start:796 stop:1137 length:342 start_codon:yes stop_codon:yes gene_type:complete